MILETMRSYFLEKESSFNDNIKLKEIIQILNTQKLIIISWIMFWWKELITKKLVEKTKIWNSFFYFNKSLDYNNELSDFEKLKDIYIENIKKYWKPKVAIIENTDDFSWIKELIKFLYQQEKLKTLIISNSIKIPWIKEIEIHINTNILNYNLEYLLNYWDIINKIEYSWNNKKSFLNILKNNIIFEEIYKTYSIRDINSYNYTLSYLSKLDSFKSQRLMLKELKSNNIKISHITLNEYINYSLKSKLISKVINYDLKKEEEIISFSKFYFKDLWIRNSLNNFSTDKCLLLENLVFNYFDKLWYKIYWWINWTFEFSFIIFLKSIKIYIHISKQNEVNEIKKEVRKFMKIKDNFPKYIIVENIANTWKSIKDLWIKKRVYENVKIVNLEEFIKEIG